MYKVFLNDRTIVIGGEGNITINKPMVFFDENDSEKEVQEWFNDFKTNQLKEVCLIHNHPGKFFRIFQSAFLTVPAAGGVVFSGDKVLFILRKGIWDLPKGKLDNNESAEEAALREVEEETGIAPVQIESRLPSTFHIYKPVYIKNPDQWVFKETSWFRMSYSGKLKGNPQREEGITRIKWFAKSQLDEVLSNTYENLKQIISLLRE